MISTHLEPKSSWVLHNHISGRGNGRYLRRGEGGGGIDDGACISMHTQGDLGHASPDKTFRLGALRSLLRPYLYPNLYLDLMSLKYRPFLEHHSPCYTACSRSLVVTCQYAYCSGLKPSIKSSELK